MGDVLFCDVFSAGKPIEGKPRIMVLQITSDEPRFVEKAKELGFASSGWREGGATKGSFQKDCFDRAALLWKIAFETPGR